MLESMSEMMNIGVSKVLLVLYEKKREKLSEKISKVESEEECWSAVKYAHTYPFAIERMLY